MTGSSSGIGRAIALEFARAGADLLLHCRRSRAAVDQTASEIRDLGRSVSVLRADFADAERLAPFVDEAWNARGLEIWVNNAGVDLLTGEDARLCFDEKLAPRLGR